LQIASFPPNRQLSTARVGFPFPTSGESLNSEGRAWRTEWLRWQQIDGLGMVSRSLTEKPDDRHFLATASYPESPFAEVSTEKL
jgi:hypothetical protein